LPTDKNQRKNNGISRVYHVGKRSAVQSGTVGGCLAVYGKPMNGQGDPYVKKQIP